jgi:hypothetical protein
MQAILFHFKKNSMKNICTKKILLFLVPGLLIMGCSKNYTNYYADGEDNGIAIFSNTGNNVLSCFIDGKPWRTVDRKTSGFAYSRTSYEVYISKQLTNSLLDTLIITWEGYYPPNNFSNGNLNLIIPVAKNFSYKDFSALQGQRLQIDTTTAFFSTSISGLNNNNTKGKGNIYFYAAQLDSIGTSSYIGKMSGLFEADFGAFKITRGRFDHLLTPENVYF